MTPSGRDTGLVAKYTFDPLSNVVFTRDQQITTRKGIIMGNLRSVQRHPEVALLHFCLKKLGVSILGRITEPGYLEGGDFFAAGPKVRGAPRLLRTWTRDPVPLSPVPS